MKLLYPDYMLINKHVKVVICTCSVEDPEPHPHVFGPPGSGSISQRYGSGSFPFLIKVLSGLIDCLKNKILTQNFSKKFYFQD
jgi:hypothetical protein